MTLKRELQFLVLFLTIFAVVVSTQIEFQAGSFGSVDLLQYWSAAKILLSGGNPYDANAVFSLERTEWATINFPILMWNPPIVFPFIIFLAFLSFKQAMLVAFVSAVLLYLVSIVFLVAKDFELFFGKRTRKLLLILFFAAFYPIYSSLILGQISPLLLFGFSGFLYFRSSNAILSGTFLSITLLKPHLLYLVYLELLLSRSWKIILGISVGVLLAAIFAFVINFEVFSFYFNSISSPPIYWRTPTFGSLLQWATDLHTPFIRLLPTFVTIAVYMLIRRRNEDLLKLTPLSLVTAPYGWLYDQLLLLPSILEAIKVALNKLENGNTKPISYLIPILFNVLLVIYLIPGSYGQEAYFWLPVVVFFLYRWILRN